MIKFENVVTPSGEQWESLILGARNAMNSWDKSDSLFNIGHHGAKDIDTLVPYRTGYDINGEEYAAYADWTGNYAIGKNDLDLMKRLRNAGTDHRKFMRMITVYVDITAPLYWWKEFDTYKVGTVANSCSTMHKIAAKEFTLEDFSTEHLYSDELDFFKEIVDRLNGCRNLYLESKKGESARIQKNDWWQMIQLLPSSYNQKRTVMMNYEVLANIYKSRKDHKLDEWSIGFIDWIKTLPYSELITNEV